MKAVGLITEYNPFHNGHLHHLRESLRVTGADVSVAVMSGHFLQRGEPALVDKWVRSEMALAAGVDLVVELPLPWACSSAPDFAAGGVAALQLLGVDTLCFGSEHGELQPLQNCARLLAAQSGELTDGTAEKLRQGISYPQARAELLAGRLPAELDAAALAAPNNILGLEYLQALQRLKSGIEPFTIQRIGAGFHETGIGEQGIASATGIRKLLAEQQPISGLLPVAAEGILQQALSRDCFFDPERYLFALLQQILRDPEGLKRFWLVENGIENRLYEMAEAAITLDQLVGRVKSRQLTRTRVQRTLVAILLGIEKETVRQLFNRGPAYLHLLGTSEQGERFLAATRKRREIPLVQNFSRVHSQLKRAYRADSVEHRQALRQLELELRATQLYTLLLKRWPQGGRSRDFYEPLRRAQTSGT